MSGNNRKVVLYIACSLDGYIASNNDDLSFLNKVQKEGEDYGFTEFEASIDTIILGRKTYDWVMDKVGEFPHKNKQVFVLTHQNRKSYENITFYNGEVKELIGQLRKEDGRHIFCDGGAGVVDAFLKDRLIDEFVISIVPILLGEGVRLFKSGQPEQDLELISTKRYDTGLVQMRYKRKC